MIILSKSGQGMNKQPPTTEKLLNNFFSLQYMDPIAEWRWGRQISELLNKFIKKYQVKKNEIHKKIQPHILNPSVYVEDNTRPRHVKGN